MRLLSYFDFKNMVRTTVGAFFWKCFGRKGFRFNAGSVASGLVGDEPVGSGLLGDGRTGAGSCSRISASRSRTLSVERVPVRGHLEEGAAVPLIGGLGQPQAPRRVVSVF